MRKQADSEMSWERTNLPWSLQLWHLHGIGNVEANNQNAQLMPQDFVGEKHIGDGLLPVKIRHLSIFAVAPLVWAG